jgi:arginase
VIEVFGVPFNSAGRTDGVARAPEALRRAGLIDAIAAAGIDVADRGDIDLPLPAEERDPESRVIGVVSLVTMVRAVREAVEASRRRGAFPLVIGGDCPVILGCLSAPPGMRRPGLLFVDGHEDAWPPDTSTTGEAADMELGWLLGLHTNSLPPDLRAVVTVLDRSRVVVVGARDVQELTDAGVESVGAVVRVVRPEEIAYSAGNAGRDFATELGRDGEWWLHVDLDVLAIESLDAVDYPQPGGLDWNALTQLTVGALSGPRPVGWDLTIYNPDLDPTRHGARSIVRYVTDAVAAFGRSLSSRRL